MPGFRVGEQDGTMGLRAIPEGRLYLDDGRVPWVSLPDGFQKPTQ